jgi:hypothetical protein
MAAGGLNMLPTPAGKSSIDLCSNFLEKVRIAVKVELETNLGALYGTAASRTHWIFALPSLNSKEELRDRFETVILNAGFPKQVYDGYSATGFSMIDEIEASAMLFQKQEVASQSGVGAIVILASYGEGSSDVISYEIINAKTFAISQFVPSDISPLG